MSSSPCEQQGGRRGREGAHLLVVVVPVGLVLAQLDLVERRVALGALARPRPLRVKLDDLAPAALEDGERGPPLLVGVVERVGGRRALERVIEVCAQGSWVSSTCRENSRRARADALMLFSFLQSWHFQTRLASPREPLMSCISCGGRALESARCRDRSRMLREGQGGRTVASMPMKLGCSSRHELHLTLNIQLKLSPTGLTASGTRVASVSLCAQQDRCERERTDGR